MEPTTPPTDGPAHPLQRCLARLTAALDEAAGVDPIYADTATKADLLVGLARVEERVHAARLAVLAAADDVADRDAARSPAAWLAHHTHQDRRTCARQQRLAAALSGRWTRTGGALAAGEVNRHQAAAIVHALHELPDHLEAALVVKAEEYLLDHAATLGPDDLRVLGRRVLEYLAPDVAEDHERKLLEAQEERARTETRLTFHIRGDGATDLRARIPDHHAAQLRTYLESFTSPRHHATGDRAEESEGDGEVARLPYARRMGEAFCALLDRLPASILPRHGGTATTVTVLIRLADLLAGTGVATLASGEAITAGQTRRMACTAGLVPAVLGTDSEVLDLGRTTRLFTAAQRDALVIRDRRCRADGCDLPAAWCEAHHLHPWATGGRTDLADAVLLCSYHHHRAHDPHYATDRLPNGDIRYTRRT